ncbi:hypothetical protein KUCAC02_030910, partial [Chaenocephalus aceratus]
SVKGSHDRVGGQTEAQCPHQYILTSQQSTVVLRVIESDVCRAILGGVQNRIGNAGGVNVE